MDNVSTARTHPIVLAAVASVLVASATATAALMGWLPATRGAPAPAEPVAAMVAAPAAQPAPQVAAPAPESKAAPQPRPVARKSVAPKPVEEPVRVAAASPVAAAPPVCHDCGAVASVRTIETPGEGSGIGAVAGGVAGGAAGSQFGKGKGQLVGAVVGAVGGAIAGHQVERHVVRKKTQYEISVRLDDGTIRTIVQDATPIWREGDRVQVIGNELRGV